MPAQFTVDSNVKVTFNEKVIDSLDVLIFSGVCCTNDSADTDCVFVNQVNTLLWIDDPSILSAVDVLEKVSYVPCQYNFKICHGQTFSSTSKYLAAFSQHTCTAEFMTMLGLSKGFPSAFRLFCHLFFIANTPSMIASELPTVDVPIAWESSSCEGTLKRRAIMETQRFWISTYC